MTDCFAAETDDNHAVNIRVERETGEHALREFGVGGNVRAADVDDDVFCTAHLRGDNAAGFGSAGAGRKNQYMISHADGTVRSFVS